MLTFLRKIRRSLVESGGAGKYLIYAIGEIALVVIGILIALQINNWNEKKKVQLKEFELLEELLFAVKSDIGLNQFTLDNNKKSDQSIEILLHHLENDLPFHDSLSFHFANAHNRWVGLLSRNAFENAKSFGLDFISQDNTKRMLIKLYQGSYDYLKELDVRNNEYYYNIVIPELTELFEKTYPQGMVFHNMLPRNYENLSSNKKYLNLLRSLQAYKRQYIVWQEHQIVRQLIKLDHLLEMEIKENSK